MDGRSVKAARRQLARIWPTPRRVLSQADLARALGVTEATVRGWELGRCTMHPSVHVLLRLYLAGILPPEELRITKP